MRICFMCQEDIVKPQGGTGTYVRNISLALARAGHDVCVISRRREGAPKVELVDGVEIYRVDAPGPPVLYSPLYFKESSRKFVELHAARPFDLVQGNLPLMSSWGLHGKDLPPIVETVHCTVREELRAIANRPLHQLNLNETLSRAISPTWASREMYLLDRARTVITVSEGLKREIVAQYEYPAERVEVIPNGVDYARFGGNPRLADEVAEVRRNLGIAPDERVILYLGRLMERKRVIDLVRAMPEVLWRIPNARLVIVGRQNSNSAALLREAQHLQVSERVTFVNHVPYNQVPGYYAMADVYCLPSAYEGFPFTVLEAMAAGTPVVATDIPGIDEQITPSRTGLLHAVGDVSQLAQHVLYVLSNKVFAAYLAAEGKKLVREKYDWAIVGEQTARVLQQAACSANHPVAAGLVLQDWAR